MDRSLHLILCWAFVSGVLLLWLIGGAVFCMTRTHSVGPFEGIGLLFSVPVALWMLGTLVAAVVALGFALFTGRV